jgi:hypothetical protein
MLFNLIFFAIVLLLSYSKYTSVTSAPTPMGFLAALIPILLWGSAKYAKVIAIISGIIVAISVGFMFMGKPPAEGDVDGGGIIGMIFGFIGLALAVPVLIVSLISMFVNRGIVSLINKDLLRRLNSGTKNVVAVAAAS